MEEYPAQDQGDDLRSQPAQVQSQEVVPIDTDTTIKLILRGMGNVLRPRRQFQDLRTIRQGRLPWESEA